MTKFPKLSLHTNFDAHPPGPSDAVPASVQRRSAASTEFLTVKEAAVVLNVSKSFLDKLRGHGGGPEFVRLGARKILYRRADLEGWARQRRYDNTSQYLERE